MNPATRPRIGVDLHTLEGLHQGSRTHCLELFARVIPLLPWMDFFLFVDTSRWAPDLRERFAFANAQVVDMPHGNPVQRLLHQLPGLVRKHRLDLLHTQYICPPVSSAANAVTIHDILFEPYPQYFATLLRLRSKLLFRRSARAADLLFTVSDYSRRELAQRYGVALDRITTIANGVDAQRFHPGMEGRDEVQRLGLQPGEYILSVGRLEPRKNHLGLLQAYATLAEPRPRLVIVGQRDFGFSGFLDARTALHLEQQVLVLEDVDDTLLPHLYRHAKLFAYPTFAEGFGMPVLEAMSSGTPVITSNTTSLPEISGDAAMLVDPHRPEQIAAAMQAVLADPRVAAEMRRVGIEQASRFGWDGPARLLADRYRDFFANR